MKKIIMSLVLLAMVSQSYAGVCRDKFLDLDEDRRIGTGGAAAVAFMAIPAYLVSGPFLVGLGSYWLISGQRPGRLAKLIDQAEHCKGRLVDKAFKAYASDGGVLSKTEMCEVILKSDEDGSLCPEGSLPTIKGVGKRYIVD